MKSTQKIKIVRENKHLTDKLEEDEIIYVISVADVQFLAERVLDRQLDYDEMYSVKKGVEWGMDYWDEVVIEAIKNLPQKKR
ncbi:MAG: hypothetical protein RBR74_09190 [Ignavibacteriaceae bacterium]|jgi:hypothetical protein|nr:hypothetical protein [Ignavibacteriaceae bacterium]